MTVFPLRHPSFGNFCRKSLRRRTSGSARPDKGRLPEGLGQNPQTKWQGFSHPCPSNTWGPTPPRGSPPPHRHHRRPRRRRNPAPANIDNIDRHPHGGSRGRKGQRPTRSRLNACLPPRNRNLRLENGNGSRGNPTRGHSRRPRHRNGGRNPQEPSISDYGESCDETGGGGGTGSGGRRSCAPSIPRHRPPLRRGEPDRHPLPRSRPGPNRRALLRHLRHPKTSAPSHPRKAWAPSDPNSDLGPRRLLGHRN